LNLDNIQVNACLRSGWQATDLGFLMARAWWPILFLCGALPALLLFIPLLVVFSDSPIWAGFIIWWLKPFWERLPLAIASRRLFNEKTTLLQALPKIKSMYFKDFLPWLLWRRLSLHRAFDAPVTVLEELKGSERRSRMKVLHGKYGDVAIANQFVCLMFELIFSLGIVLLLSFFIPDDFGIDAYDSVDELTYVGEWIYTVAAFIAMTLVMPFHCMAGFALYLNRRIELEAWDIEISFRSLVNRKQSSENAAIKMLLVMVLSIGMASLTPTDVYAASDHDKVSASQLIEEVMQGEDFGQEKTVQKWRFINWVEENEDKIPDWIIEFFDWLEANIDWVDGSDEGSNTATGIKVLLVLAFISLLGYLFWKNRGPLKRLMTRLGSSPASETAPEILFGLDVTPESLPENVPEQVLKLWRSEQFREALGLLYRASLSRLIERYELAFRASHTEAECAELVRARGIDSLSDYFTSLTNVWRRLAYGHLLPEQEIVLQLCAAWAEELRDETA
jgi:hypothetical protein